MAHSKRRDSNRRFSFGRRPFHCHIPKTHCGLREVERVVRAGGQEFQLVGASTPGELDKAFERMAIAGRSVLIVAIDPFFNEQSKQITALATQHAIPAVYYTRVFMLSGGLASYGGDSAAAYKLAGEMVGKILRGAKPQEMPIQQSIKFELVINLKTAKSLGLKIPDRLLALADEVIE